MWWLALVYMLGWTFHRLKKATGWVATKRRAGGDVRLRDWLRCYGYYTLSDACTQAIISVGWAAGFFRAALEKVIPAEYIAVPDKTGILVEVALALLAGYVGASVAHEIISRRRAKKSGESVS